VGWGKESGDVEAEEEEENGVLVVAETPRQSSVPFLLMI
jgi:hypothetical protein